MVSVKKQVSKVLKHLPADCSLEDVQYHLYVLETIRRRMKLADQGKFVPQSTVAKRMAKWLVKESGWGRQSMTSNKLTGGLKIGSAMVRRSSQGHAQGLLGSFY